MSKLSIPSTNKKVMEYLQDILLPGEEYYPVDPMHHEHKSQLKYSMWRLDSGAIRFYWSPEFRELFGNDLFAPQGNGFGASVTSIIKAQAENKPWLNQWQSNIGGYDQAQSYMNERADYGTLFHMLITELFRLREIDLNLLPEIVQEYVRLNNIWFLDTRSWAEDLKNDLTGVIQWVKDYDVVPIALEVPIYVPVYDPHTNEIIYMAAGTPDLVCDMYAKNYSEKTLKKHRKRVRAVIDFKSGRKGFYEEHEIQANVYQKAWNWNMENFIIDRRSTSRFICSECANWAPTASRGASTTYKFTWQTGKDSEALFYHYVKEFIIKKKHEISNVRRIGGKLKMGEDTSQNVSFMDPEKFMKQRWDEFNEAEQQRKQEQESEEQEGNEDES